ncbi:TPA: hypothetical protein MFB39_000771 [Klebsiella pneumoniae]|uniref:Thoeris anti-defense Tad2 family protein n=1 Tax=Klebsiella pneumoniae TaxID=573 RepID=UPI0025A0292F|nr:hypothetical protein [Klebsiella pneumoniae]MDM7427943.1 hypothetical protein [Klebsiella pneumoniae]HBU8487321.1 hypothetical protein [Klebsiella pneumoniae]HBW4786355.1 hypothetical protein [Klebsiella pneumoniae]HBW5338586.1 hypothetical protein [Klebsiella pneumoniae]HBW5415265.1 hypothetical protein [Klebsiella pneumoniae]
MATYSYSEAITLTKSGGRLRRPAWPTGCYIVYDGDTSDDMHPDSTVDYIDTAGMRSMYVPADFDEMASDWQEYTL